MFVLIGKKWLSSPADYRTRATDKVYDPGLLCGKQFHFAWQIN